VKAIQNIQEKRLDNSSPELFGAIKTIISYVSCSSTSEWSIMAITRYPMYHPTLSHW